MNKPEFLGPFRSLKIAYKSLYSYSSKNNPGLPYIIRLRKNLLLNRMVKFNGQYYSSLTVPAYPSPAYDLMVEKNGLFFDKMGSGEKRNLESAFLGISSKCHNNCTHCYEQHNLSTDGEVPVEKWIETVKTLQEMGTNIIILTGGEPLLRYNELLKVLRAGDKNKSDFHIHTSGITLTIEKAAQLKLAGLKAAAVGFEDHVPERFEKLRSKGMFKTAVNTLKYFNEAGVLTYVNLCATKELINSGTLTDYYEFVKELNVSFIQLLEPRPCGGFMNGNGSVMLNAEEKNALLQFTRKVNYERKYKDGPIVYYVAHIEHENQLGCCMGGTSQFHLDCAGNVNPCVFLPVSFGNILEEDFTTVFNRMRLAVPTPVKKECASLLLSDAVKQYSGEGVPIPYSKIENYWRELL